jgi:hypothetical protein
MNLIYNLIFKIIIFYVKGNYLIDYILIKIRMYLLASTKVELLKKILHFKNASAIIKFINKQASNYRYYNNLKWKMKR